MVYLTVIILLFLFAVFDLHVGVSNDAVNFLNSAIGSKVAKFRVILLVAGIGVFAGAVMSNGMMDVARHGIFHPQFFTYNEVICIMLGMMTTDVVLLDVFNTLGMPTSTTISLVFELLGGSVALAIYKTANDPQMNFSELLNTEHALTMILAIFISVAIAFVVGMLVQYICRLAFSFNYKRRLKYFIGIFGGLAVTALVYFMLIKNIKGSALITSEGSQWIADNSVQILLICFVVATILMQILNWAKVSVLRIVVLLGTFALAMAFAANDMVNFIGVPLAGFSAYQDFMANAHGLAGDSYYMTSLMSSARTPVIFLIIAGAIMMYSLMTSKKAQNVVKTSVDLSRQEEGDEMFGTSSIARTLVRASVATSRAFCQFIPEKVLTWIDLQFNKDEMIKPKGAAFDLLRAAVNLVISALLIAWGTSYKLPLSTTYVTFMVAMGTSLSDRAWGRESAVFRVTGVLSVIGGWFITAAVAFLAAFVVTTVMYFGQLPAMLIISLIAVVVLVRSNIYFKRKTNDENRDEVFYQYMNSQNADEVLRLLKKHVAGTVDEELDAVSKLYEKMLDALKRENLRDVRRVYDKIDEMKDQFKRNRRRELLGLRKYDSPQAIIKGTYFHMLNNSMSGMIYGLKRLCEVFKEHLEKNYEPLPPEFYMEFQQFSDQWLELLASTNEYLMNRNFGDYHRQFGYIDAFRQMLTMKINEHIERLQQVDDTKKLNSYIVYMSLLQETQAEAAMLKQVVRNYVKLEEA